MCHDPVEWDSYSISGNTTAETYYKSATFHLPLDAAEFRFLADADQLARGNFDVSSTLYPDSPVALVNVQVSYSHPGALKRVTTCRIGREGVWGLGIFVRAPMKTISIPS